MREQPMGLIEAQGWIEAYGELVLTEEEQQWAEKAGQRRGCRLKADTLTQADRERLVALGRRCKQMKEMRGIK